MRRMGPSALWILVMALVTGCTGGTTPTSAPTNNVTPSTKPSPDVAPSPSPSLDLPTVEPATSSLPAEIVAAIEWRRGMGLRTDPEWVLLVAEDPSAIDAWAYPILPEEDRFIWDRQARLSPVVAAALEYGHKHADVFGGLYLDNANSQVMTLWTTDPAGHLAAMLADAGPGAPIAARLVRWTERQLKDVKKRVGWDSPLWERVDADLEGVGVDISGNAVHIEISSANPEAPSLIATALASRLGVPRAMFRVESDGTGVSRMPIGKVKGIVVLADGSGPGPDNGLMIGGRSEGPGRCYTEPFGVGPDADGRFTIPCTVGTWVITVWTFDRELKRTVVWGESEPVVVSEDEVPRVHIRVAADTPIGE